jgi:hypothetical protein
VDVPPTQLIKQRDNPATPQKGKWKLALMIAAVHGATEFDRQSTYAVFNRCASCYEANPLLRPIIRNKPGTAAVMHGISGLADISMWKLREKGKWYWWIPGAVHIGVHVFAGVHNSRIK